MLDRFVSLSPVSPTPVQRMDRLGADAAGIARGVAGPLQLAHRALGAADVIEGADVGHPEAGLERRVVIGVEHAAVEAALGELVGRGSGRGLVGL